MLLCIMFVAAPPPAYAASDPAGFVADLGKRATDELASKLSDADRESRFRALFDEGFDVPSIARFVLGPHWRTASEAQRREFVDLFQAYVVRAYAMRFREYSGQQLKVLGTRPAGDNAALVQSQVALPNGGTPVNVDWRIAATDAGYKITDVIVEGVSMAVTQRQEFASVIQRNGGQLEALLQAMREKTGLANR